MRTSTHWFAGIGGVVLAVLAVSPCSAQNAYNSAQPATGARQTTSVGTNNVANLEASAQQAINTFKLKDPSLDKFFRSSAGYAIFPSVGEGAFIVGGAHGNGIVYQNGQAIGEASVTKGTIGAQAGAGAFSEVIFFQTPQSLQRFKQGNFEFSAGVNAVVANAGVGTQTNYRDGVAVFTTSRTGLMAKAAIGGQKFTYQPLAMGGGGFMEGGTSSGTSTNGLNSGIGTPRK